VKRNPVHRILRALLQPWTYRRSLAFACFVVFGLCCSTLGMAAGKLTDYKGFKDPTLLSRLPNYYLPYASSFKEQQFDAYTFSVTEGGKSAKQKIEGHATTHCYSFDPSAGTMPSPLQILRNCQNAVTRIGGEILYEDQQRTTLRVAKNDLETWLEIMPVNGGLSYYVRIVERQAMKQEVTANAEAMQAGLAQSGHVEVPGIFFDFNKAEIKPESEPALLEVAKLLKASPALHVWVVGHTDYVGSAEANVVLAKARAAAVVQALTQKHGVDAKRLLPFGVGPYAPVAANLTDAGRAKNRRVELVAQPQ
jgi:OmpA-OmpF porin, OOP family